MKAIEQHQSGFTNKNNCWEPEPTQVHPDFAKMKGRHRSHHGARNPNQEKTPDHPRRVNSVINFSAHFTTLVILNVTEGGVRDLLYLPFNIGAERRSTISKFKAVKNWMPIPSEA
jgi:hypothetical protein